VWFLGLIVSVFDELINEDYVTANSRIWPSVHEFVYENPGTDAAVIDSGSPKQLPPKVAKKVLTDYEKRELRNRKAHERRAKKAAENAAENGESEGDDVSSTRKWGRRGRGTQPKSEGLPLWPFQQMKRMTNLW